MWAKRFDNVNLKFETMSELHAQLKAAYGENFLEAFDYIPPAYATEDIPYCEFRFENEPGDLAPAEDLLEQFKADT